VSPEQFVIPSFEGAKETESIQDLSGDDEKKCKNFYQLRMQKGNNEFSTWVYLKLIKEQGNTKMLAAVSTTSRTNKYKEDEMVHTLLIEKLSIKNPFLRNIKISPTPVKTFKASEYKQSENYLEEICNK
jgi:hypothetical protein